jgi:3-oxoacyl-[acyl-carrier protein] reductase
VHYGRGVKEADGLVAQIRKAGGRADSIAADLATADGPRKLAKLARDIIGERLDVLITNAGIAKAATIEDTTIEDFDQLFAVNVRAPFFLVQQLLPIMSQGSSIIFVSWLPVSSKPTCRTSPRRITAMVPPSVAIKDGMNGRWQIVLPECCH